MNPTDLAQTTVVGATDVALTSLGDDRFEILAGPRRYVVKAPGKHGAELRDVVTRLVPRLTRSIPLREQLPAEDLDRLLPFADQLTHLGVLLPTGPDSPVRTAADRALYSFIARRTDTPGPAYGAVKDKPLALTGDALLTAPLATALAEQGLVLAEPGTTPALTVVVATDEAELDEANQRLCDAGCPLVPVFAGLHQVRVGPWTIPGETACLSCFGPVGTTADATRVSPASWSTTQPAALRWLGGLMAHQALRAFLPIEGEHPWGRVTTVDTTHCEQTTTAIWRDPYCSVCTRHAPAAQEWTEV
ncbi:hypothetical protein [Streptomyces orinoci]|uniref:Bacteriocin biosynthesis cyclodehydratase domain-containing protein n=1 Tax=Streptomyces orinoci TaxID=67339 RepID=A0ABV3JQJ8_STRON|nr:hypothetical protein [Streptomyces orinoci]